MILIADSGSTKTEWLMASREDNNKVQAYKTEGINPVHQGEDIIREVLGGLPNEWTEEVTEVYFYGSGVLESLKPMMRKLLAARFPKATTIVAEGDLLGAARALCGHEEGIACILGTGANSCLYDGERIVMNTPPMGYVLGDEGSGAVLGRNLLNAMYKGLLDESIVRDFEREQKMTMADVINRVYRQPMANRWLASLTPFIAQHKEESAALKEMVIEGFCQFIQRNVERYGRKDLPLSAVGSIAWYFKDELSSACERCGWRLGRVVQGPARDILAFHLAM